jgi:hypothetical protein
VSEVAIESAVAQGSIEPVPGAGAHLREGLLRAPHTHILDGVSDLPGVLLEESAPLTAA